MSSVHLSTFPEVHSEWEDLALAQRWERLFALRQAVQINLEAARQTKFIGSSLEAAVTIEVPDEEIYRFYKHYEQDLPAILIVSQVKLQKVDQAPSISPIGILKASGMKCERCWNYRPAVGTFKDHPTLCDRCVEAV